MPPFEDGLIALLPRARRFARGLTGDAADADDLLQTAVERALRSRDQWQAGTRLDSWLYRILRNAWIDTVRARGRRAKVLAPEEAGEDRGHDPRPAIEAGIDLAAILKAMERLPAEQREVVVLILIEGFGYREAAEILDLPMGTVSSRLVRGREALMALIGEGAVR